MHMAKLKPGPPSKFTQELADQICDLMVEGHDLVESCDILKLNRRTVFRWLNEYPEFDTQCARARETLTEVRLSKVREKVVKAQQTGVDPNLLKIEVGFEQWVAERIAPRYSTRTKTEVSGPNGGPVQIERVDLSHLSDEELEILDIALNGRSDDEDDDE
jgi:hypothetical protein